MPPDEGMGVPEWHRLLGRPFRIPRLRWSSPADVGGEEYVTSFTRPLQTNNYRGARFRLASFHEPRQSRPIRPLGKNDVVTLASFDTNRLPDNLTEIHFFGDELPPAGLNPAQSFADERENRAVRREVTVRAVHNRLT